NDEIRKLHYRIVLGVDNNRLPMFHVRHDPDIAKQRDKPYKVINIRPKEVKFQNPQTTADPIGLSNQVFVQKSQMGGGSPMIRGFSANNVLIVVDGVRMNNAIFRDGNVHNIISIDPHILGQTQVLFGPGSVIYGSDAMGGVMVFETKNPKIQPKQYYQGNVMLRTATANRENSWHVDLSYGKGKLSGLSSITLSNYGELKMGANGPEEYTRPTFSEYNGRTDSIIQNEDPNVQYFTSYTQVNFNQKIRYKPDSLTDAVIHFGYTTTSPIPRYDRLIQTQNNQPRFGDWYYGPQKWTQINGRVERKFRKKRFADKMTGTLAYQRFEESRFVRRFRSFELEHTAEVVDVNSLNLDFDKKVKKLDLMYGIELVTNKVQSKAEGSQIDSGTTFNIATRYPDGSYMNTAAVYLSAKRELGKSFLLTLGSRYSYIDLHAPFENSFYSFPFSEINLQKSAFSGSLGLRYMINKKSFVFANLASGFRAPNVDDMGKIFDSQPDRVIVPNDNLLPEYSYNGEVGFYVKLAGDVELLVNGFYTIIDNVIVRQDHSINGQDSLFYQGQMLRIQSLVNSEQGAIYGLETQLKVPLTRELDFKTSYNVLTGSQSDGTPLRHVSPNFGRTSIEWNQGKLKVQAYALYNAELSNSKLAPVEQAKA
ncbi:MAG: TonB-dependent receptor, partial [Bacteroidia bacterium]|nr:TonB-dependent receptor [Bacteroidia bacterium]